MNDIKTLTQDDVTRVNQKLQRMNLQIRVTDGDDSKKVIDQVMQEVNPDFKYEDVMKLKVHRKDK